MWKLKEKRETAKLKKFIPQCIVMLWAYMIYTREPNNPESVKQALGRDLYNGELDMANMPGGKIWRFEIDYRLDEQRKEKLKFPSPGMAGFTEVSDATPFLTKRGQLRY